MASPNSGGKCSKLFEGDLCLKQTELCVSKLLDGKNEVIESHCIFVLIPDKWVLQCINVNANYKERACLVEQII